MERLGLGLLPGAGWTAAETQEVARDAEAAGFSAVLAAEVNNDVMATAQLMGQATSAAQVGTWVANVFLRHPYVCAQGASLIGEATGGRFLLGLGVSHQPVNSALGIEMADAGSVISAYAESVQGYLRGEGPPTHLPQHPAPRPVPVYVAALTSRTVERAAALADGVMPLFWSVDRVARSRAWVERGRAQAPGRAPLDVALGLPVYVGDDLAALRDAARANLALFTFFPFFQHLFRVSGFEPEAGKMVAGDGAAALSDRLLDAVCLIGPVDRCQERLDAYRAAGVGLPILMPPVGVAAARAVVEAFAR
jgi:alkanesulfonate monooxygenase SsuD/methylene tetrahydromethanopterin reductase-like flavin-dependent oxidoreductase (luciferase family)